jgi:hypothetical protein
MFTVVSSFIALAAVAIVTLSTQSNIFVICVERRCLVDTAKNTPHHSAGMLSNHDPITGIEVYFLPSIMEPPVVSNNDSDEDDEYMQSFAAYAEPLLRVTVAGLGGFISGLAVVRYRRQAPMMSSVEASISHPVLNSRHKIMMIPRQTTSSNLPAVWGLCCFVFCGLLEITRLYEPTKLLIQTMPASNGVDSGNLNPFFLTCADYALGGAVAGATFRGMQLTASAQQRRIPISSARPSIGMGMLTGIALGLLAGLVQAGLDYAAAILQTKEQEQSNKVDHRK